MTRTQRFEDLTDEQVRTLTDEQVERYIDLECALAGVPLLPATAPVKPDGVQKQKDIEAYEVGDIVFVNRVDADEIATLANHKPRLTTTYSHVAGAYEQVATAAEDDVAVKVVRHYSPQRWAQEREAVSAAARAENAYQSEVRAYDETVKRRREASEHVRRRIEDVHENYYRQQQLQREYDRYLDLADGNAEVAARFLDNAHHDAREVMPHLFVSAAEPADSEAVHV